MSETRIITNCGNFALDREKAVRAGHVGGHKSSGNFANDRARAVKPDVRAVNAATVVAERRTTGAISRRIVNVHRKPGAKAGTIATVSSRDFHDRAGSERGGSAALTVWSSACAKPGPSSR